MDIPIYILGALTVLGSLVYIRTGYKKAALLTLVSTAGNFWLFFVIKFFSIYPSSGTVNFIFENSTLLLILHAIGIMSMLFAVLRAKNK